MERAGFVRPAVVAQTHAAARLPVDGGRTRPMMTAATALAAHSRSAYPPGYRLNTLEAEADQTDAGSGNKHARDEEALAGWHRPLSRRWRSPLHPGRTH